MEELSIIEQGITIGKESERFIISNKNKKIAEIPVYRVNTINIYGNNQITTQAITLALNKGIDINFLKTNGQLKGKLGSNISNNIMLRLKQYKIYEDETFKLNISKEITKNKINNQYKLLNYYGIKVAELKEIINNVDKCESINEVMGFEGISSRIYFENLSNVVPEDFAFKGRSRRPPKDEFNALISLTYQILLNRITAHLEIQGIDTMLGYLHSIKYGRESLSLDMLEEFRQGFCDFFILKLINRKQINKSDFIVKDNGGFYLNEEAFKEFLKIFNKEYEKLEVIIKEKASLMRKAIEDEDYKIYVPYSFIKKS